MKTKLFILIIFISSTINAQNKCSQFYPSEKGVSITLHHFNQKNKLTSKTSYQILDVSSSGSKTVLTMNVSLKDAKKNLPINETEFKIICDGGTTYLDPESIISPKLFNQYKGMEYSIDGEGIAIPNSLSVGQELPDGKVTMYIDAGVMNIDMAIDLENRTVQAKETVTTPAGSFDCYIISYTNTISMSLGVKQTFYVKQWISKGVGLVKQETTKTNGKLMSRSILAQLQ